MRISDWISDVCSSDLIITRKPSMNGFSGDFVGSYGDRNSINLGGYVNVPLSDTLAWTLSAQRTAHDAYSKNTAPDTPYSASNFPDGSYIGDRKSTRLNSSH